MSYFPPQLPDEDAFESISAAIELAEVQRSQGNLLGAYDAYRTILTHRLKIQVRLKQIDMVVVHNLADLAILFGCGSFEVI